MNRYELKEIGELVELYESESKQGSCDEGDKELEDFTIEQVGDGEIELLIQFASENIGEQIKNKEFENVIDEMIKEDVRYSTRFGKGLGLPEMFFKPDYDLKFDGKKVKLSITHEKDTPKYFFKSFEKEFKRRTNYPLEISRKSRGKIMKKDVKGGQFIKRYRIYKFNRQGKKYIKLLRYNRTKDIFKNDHGDNNVIIEDYIRKGIHPADKPIDGEIKKMSDDISKLYGKGLK